MLLISLDFEIPLLILISLGAQVSLEILRTEIPPPPLQSCFLYICNDYFLSMHKCLHSEMGGGKNSSVSTVSILISY